MSVANRLCFANIENEVLLEIMTDVIGARHDFLAFKNVMKMRNT